MRILAQTKKYHERITFFETGLMEIAHQVGFAPKITEKRLAGGMFLLAEAPIFNNIPAPLQPFMQNKTDCKTGSDIADLLMLIAKLPETRMPLKSVVGVELEESGVTNSEYKNFLRFTMNQEIEELRTALESIHYLALLQKNGSVSDAEIALIKKLAS